MGCNTAIIVGARGSGLGARGSGLGTGGWRLEVGGWRLEAGGWRLEAGGQRLGTRGLGIRITAMLNLKCSAAACVITACVSVSVVHAQTRGVTAEDYLAFETLGDPQFSPDGSTIAYVVTRVDKEQNRRRSEIWTVAADGTRQPVELTTAPQSSNSPRWKPDGTALAFPSARPMPGQPASDTPKTQVWLLPLSGGEPRRVTNLLNGVSSVQWSPDGTRLAIVSRSGPSDSGKSPSDVRHYFHANYKFNDSGWFDDKREHLWIVDVATGAATQVTSGDGWNDADPQWSPDGRRIAFVSDRSGHEFDESNDTDIWVMNADGGGLAKISDHNTEDASPRWSPDGQTIAFVTTIRDTANKRIWITASTGGAPSHLAVDDL